MAEQENEDRTEQASERRLREARERGDIPVGRDAATLAALAAAAGALSLSAGGLRDGLVALVRGSVDAVATGDGRSLVPLMAKPAAIAGIVCAATAVAAALAFLVQTRGGVWPELLLPDPQRMFGGGRLRRLFRKEVLADAALVLVKLLTLGWALWASLRDEFLTLPALLAVGSEAQLAALFRPLAGGLVKILTALAVIAGLDLAITHLRYRKKMMMTREEAKREYREEEGDPLFRSRRKRRHRELLKGQIAVEVPKADALLVNPTHIAIALRYRPGEDKAPRVTAKGKGEMAEAMRALAREHGIPIVEDITLARLLFKRVKVGRTVPVETYKAVAAVLAFVYRVLGRGPAHGAEARR